MSRDTRGCAEATTRESQRGRRQIEPTGLLAGSSGWLALSRKGKLLRYQSGTYTDMRGRDQRPTTASGIFELLQAKYMAERGIIHSTPRGSHAADETPPFKWSQSAKINSKNRQVLAVACNCTPDTTQIICRSFSSIFVMVADLIDL
jgi:hypothetical protein